MDFTGADNAVLHDRQNPWSGKDSAFHDPVADQAGGVLGVGCGTGQMLIVAR